MDGQMMHAKIYRWMEVCTRMYRQMLYYISTIICYINSIITKNLWFFTLSSKLFIPLLKMMYLYIVRILIVHFIAIIFYLIWIFNNNVMQL